MNIVCPNCGREHSLFWYQALTEKKVCYICDNYPSRGTHKVSGHPEIRRTRKRCVYHEAVGAKEGASIPTVWAKSVSKKENDAHQEKFGI